MNLSEYLLNKNLSIPQILQATRSVFELMHGDILFVSGSLVEGLGNEKSDIDLFLVTDRMDLEYNACQHDISVIVADCLIDIRVLHHDQLGTLLDRFHAWGNLPRHSRRAFEFVDDERKLLYRIKIGEALFGGSALKALQEKIPSEHLALHKLDWARHLASAIQVDLAGFRNQDDCLSMLFSAQELLGHCMDAILAAKGFANPTTKWRTRYLSRLGDDFLAGLPGNYRHRTVVGLYLDYHRIPAEISSQDVYDLALKIVAFSRVAFPWAERTLLAPDDSPLACSFTVRPPAGLALSRPIDHLDVDVEVRYRNGGFEMSRLNAVGPNLRLSDDAYCAICLFDGKTSLESVNSGPGVVGDMVNLVRFARLGARPMVDESRLRKVLHRDHGQPT